MKRSNYKNILIFIATVITMTVLLQIYWNIKKYKADKIQLLVEVQKTFDSSIEKYFANELKGNIFMFTATQVIGNTRQINDLKPIPNVLKSNLTKSNQSSDIKKILESITTKNIDKINPSKTIIFKNGKNIEGEINNNQIDQLAKKIAISLSKDSIKLEKLHSLLKEELKRKNIDIPFVIKEFKSTNQSKRCFPKNCTSELSYNYSSNSNYLPKDTKVEIHFFYPFFMILKKGIFEIILSFTLSISVIFCLFYLLKTINRQKKTDEIKNDLISNITHEFKTPITTISAAIEGIKHFNSINDTEKTNRYLEISTNQLQKLENMVEKLLETATLHTDEVVINFELINITKLISTIIENKLLGTTNKEIFFKAPEDAILTKVDSFHFENCIINLIDNAIKYGGNKIELSINTKDAAIEITVKDNGMEIPKEHRDKIFEKFYRIPKGNTHDVKGFGIGLYYCKQIIKKHNGTIILDSSEGTNFILNFPKNE